MSSIHVSFVVKSGDLRVATLVQIIDSVFVQYKRVSGWLSDWWYGNMILMGNWRHTTEPKEIVRPDFEITNVTITRLED